LSRAKIKLIKTFSVIIAVTLWIAVLITIYQTKVPFNQQVPKCMFSTMIIFGVLIGIFKLIERLENS